MNYDLDSNVIATNDMHRGKQKDQQLSINNDIFDFVICLTINQISHEGSERDNLTETCFSRLILLINHDQDFYLLSAFKHSKSGMKQNIDEDWWREWSAHIDSNGCKYRHPVRLNSIDASEVISIAFDRFRAVNRHSQNEVLGMIMSSVSCLLHKITSFFTIFRVLRCRRIKNWQVLAVLT
jgi:hypothetical protein